MARILCVALLMVAACQDTRPALSRQERDELRADAEAEAGRAKSWPCIPANKTRYWMHIGAALPEGLPKRCAGGPIGWHPFPEE